MVAEPSKMADTPTGAVSDVDLSALHYSTKGLRGFIWFLEEREGREVIDGALMDAGLPRSHVIADDLWVSAEWQRRFQLALAARIFKLPELPAFSHPMWQLWREAGWVASRRENIGVLYDLVRAIGSPDLAVGQFPRLVRMYNRTLDIDILEHRSGYARLAFSGSRGLDCATAWNTVGTLERLPSIWDLPDAQVNVLDNPCVDPSVPRLVLEIRFEQSEVVRKRWLALVGILGGSAGFLLGDITVGVGGGVWGGIAGVGIGLAFMLHRWLRRAEAELQREGQNIETLVNAQDVRYHALWEEERKLRRSLLASQKLSGYLSADLVEEILENPEMETRLGGRRTDAAVLFADLVGFTPRTERRDPEVVVEELNIYFGFVDQAFARNGGIIDKRMGDGVMGVFVPLANEDAASVRLRAVQCGLDLLTELHRCNQVLSRRGSEPFQARVGVAAGPLVQGTMGSTVKFEYTVIGDVVNTAARLEGQARPGHLVVPADVFDQLDDGVVLAASALVRRRVLVKGKSEPIEVVELAPLPFSDGA